VSGRLTHCVPKAAVKVGICLALTLTAYAPSITVHMGGLEQKNGESHAR